MKILLLLIALNGDIYYNIMDTTIEECHALAIQTQLKTKNIIKHECLYIDHITKLGARNGKPNK